MRTALMKVTASGKNKGFSLADASVVVLFIT